MITFRLVLVLLWLLIDLEFEIDFLLCSRLLFTDDDLLRLVCDAGFLLGFVMKYVDCFRDCLRGYFDWFDWFDFMLSLRDFEFEGVFFMRELFLMD